MKRLSFLLILLSISFAGFSQMPVGEGAGRPGGTAPRPVMNETAPKGNSKITGYAVDSSVTKAVEFANVVLYNKATNKVVDGTAADDKGKFTFSKLAVGEYKIVISFIGFSNATIDNIQLAKGQDLDLGVVKLKPDVKLLDEVTVTGQKSIIEEKVDRLVYNAEQDIAAKGGDAADVLRKVPMLTVDLDGNISLRGSSNIRVLINNKPSTIVASSVSDALKQIPADMIKSVEVITSPSAKYDAEGSGGIINIITKKTTVQGLTLNVDSGIGNRGSNLGLNGSYRNGKLGINLGGFGRAFYNKATTDLQQLTNQNGKDVRTNQTADAFDNGLFGQYTLGLDYDLGPKQSLTAGVRYGVRNFKRDQDQTTNIFTDNLLTSSALRQVNSQDNSGTIDVNVDYLRTFKPQQEWSVSGQFSRNNLTNNFVSNLMDKDGALASSQKNVNLNTNQEITFQTDYQTPLAKNQLLEFGVKGIFRQVNSDYQYLFSRSSNASYITDVTRPSGFLNYDQNIAGTYFSYTLTTPSKYTFKIGSRYEYTSINAKSQQGDITIPTYGTLVPSINISKSLGESTTLKLSYNRRIQRPGLQQLNPNFNASNPQNITVGNPNLKPELTNNIELGFSTNINKTYFNVSLFGRQTDNSITQIRTPSDTLAGAVITTFQNIGREQVYGTNVFANVSITPKWSINGGFDLYHTYLEGQTPDLTGKSVAVSNSGFVIGGRIMTQIQLPKGWGIQGFGGMRGNQVQLQGTQGSFYMYSLGVKKDFNNKKGSIGIAGENFFGGVQVNSEFNSAQFTQLSSMHLMNQGIKLTFSYKIGKMTFTAPKKTKSIKNDDVKAGEGGNGGQQ